VYSEIALTVIYHPTGCGCAFTISVVKPRPRKPDVASVMSVNAAYSTKVTKFSIVVYDVEADQVELVIPEFADMALNPNTTDLIEKAVAADPNGDFASITAGFAGTIKDFPNLPEQLNKNDPKNANFVPAIMFSIQQIYLTGAMFIVPCALDMSTAPNAYTSQCQPYRADAPYAYSKRAALDYEESEQAALATPVAWFREFLLFPKQKSTCGNSGYEPKTRYITSFYNDPNCKSENGYLSFDRELTSTFTSANAVVGGWEWKRDFGTDPRVVFGVPQSFSTLTAVWCLGYSQISWVSPSNFAATQVPVQKGVCQSFPASGWVSEVQATKYKESHQSFPLTAAVQCVPAYKSCASDTTVLAFQNDNPRDFSKKEDSVLLTGPRRAFCTDGSQENLPVDQRVVFDTLTFRGVNPGEALAKRNEDDTLHKKPHQLHMVYDPKRDGLVFGRHAPELAHAANIILRKRAETPIVADPVAAPAHRDDFGMNTATGSVDNNGLDGKDAGDHPISKFPETYSAPLTLDPVQSASMEEPLVYKGTLVTGTPPKFCDKGDLGCGCRDDSTASKCDHGYECNTLSYCVRPACPQGQAGCKTLDGDKCNDGLVSEDGFCVQKPSCPVGTIGCICDANAACSDGDCLDNRCIRATMDVCTAGTAGCPCTSDAKCGGNAACDEYSGLCLFDSCAAGSAGCRCSKQNVPCEDGFACSAKGSCVQLGCTPGDAGCACLTGKKCNKKGFTCVELDRSGADTICVGEDLCGQDQTARCELECGKGNIAACGMCSYSQPVCRDPGYQFCNPKSYLFGVQECVQPDSSSSATLLSLLAAVIAAVALF
jgi:hypothetical protein